MEKIEIEAIEIKTTQPVQVQEQVPVTRIQSSSKIKKCSKNVKAILLETSLQFLLSPFRTKRTLIKILITSCLSVYLVIKNIIDYLDFETVTSIKTMIENQADFPVISFCSKNKQDIENVIEFWFNNENLIDDWQNHFSIYNDILYEKCYRFNSGFDMSNKSIKLKKSYRAGYDDGFIFEFNASSDYGILLLSIHNQTFFAKTLYNREYRISPNTQDFFAVKRIYDKKLANPYNDCLKDASDFNLNKTLINYMKNNNLKYSQQECKILCLNLKFSETNCDCPVLLEDFLYWKCYEWSELSIQKCYNSFMKKYNKNNNCDEYCPLECDSFRYDISESSNVYFNSSFSSFNTYKFYVYYADLKYTLISQQSLFDFFDLISNIGGSLGLFLGISFISFLELFEIIFEFLITYFNFK